MRRGAGGKRRDGNEKSIVEDLKKLPNVEVWYVSGADGQPDILVRVGGVDGTLHGFEVKRPKGKRTKAQEKSLFPIVRTLAEALERIGVRE